MRRNIHDKEREQFSGKKSLQYPDTSARPSITGDIVASPVPQHPPPTAASTRAILCSITESRSINTPVTVGSGHEEILPSYSIQHHLLRPPSPAPSYHTVCEASTNNMTMVECLNAAFKTRYLGDVSNRDDGCDGTIRVFETAGTATDRSLWIMGSDAVFRTPYLSSRAARSSNLIVYGEAIEAFERVYNKSATSARLWEMLGGAYKQVRCYREAIIAYEHAIDIYQILLKKHPTCAQMWELLGDAFVRRGDHIKAAEAFEKAIDLTDKWGKRLTLIAAKLFNSSGNISPKADARDSI
jgi:hypothetical protein